MSILLNGFELCAFIKQLCFQDQLFLQCHSLRTTDWQKISKLKRSELGAHLSFGLLLWDNLEDRRSLEGR